MGLSICRVTHALYPDMIGGHAIFCADLSARQTRSGHRIQLFTARRDNLPRHQKMDGYTVTRLDSVWMPWESLGMSNPLTPALYGSVARSRCDLVDAHAHLFWTTALAVKAALDTGKPVVTTVHGFLALRDWLANTSQRLYLLSVGAWALRNSSRVVCLTRSDAEQVASLGVKRGNIRVIPTAVDLGTVTRRESGGENAVWIGRMVPEKGLQTLLEALAKLGEAKAPSTLVVGDGPMRSRLIALCQRLGISDSVRFKRSATRSEVRTLLRDSGIFVLPSLKEGLPLSLLEAMAESNMIIASRLSSIEEVLGDAGLYFTPGDASELADVLARASGDPVLRRQKGQAAREIVERRFSWKVVLPQLDDLYKEVVAP
jgi:glycosyltransferase involved in cell wall biosynthesis